MKRPWLGGRRRIGAALALLVTIAVVVVIVLVTQSSTSPGNASASSQSSGTTAVQRRNLVATDTESGTLSYSHPQTVYNRLSGTITWLPAVGQVIHQGDALFKVNGLPVTLMNGNTPAYRDLNASDSNGPDILQLNRDLIALGYTSEGIVADDVWQPATSAAVEVFQESVGESPTGSLSLGQIVFLPGSQVVSTVEGTLGGGTSAFYHPGASSAEFVSQTTTTQTTTTPPPSRNHGHHHGASSASSATTLAALIALLKAESAQLKAESAQLRAAEAASHANGKSGSSGGGSSGGGSSGGGSGSHGGGSSSGGSGSSGGGSSGSSGAGSAGGAATAVLQTSSTQLVATVDLDASKQSEAKVGEKVTVQMPAGNTVNGTVSAVSPVAQSSSGSGSGSGNGNGNGGSNGAGGGGSGNGSGNGSSSATVPVTITLGGHQSGAGLDQAAVSVNFVQSEANNVLSVPVTALLATSGGGYAVQAAAPPHSLIPVTTGLFAAGYVQISGPRIYPGLQVTDSQG
jgi:uncharacterized small protein (DUF1192 family)